MVAAQKTPLPVNEMGRNCQCGKRICPGRAFCFECMEERVQKVAANTDWKGCRQASIETGRALSDYMGHGFG